MKHLFIINPAAGSRDHTLQYRTAIDAVFGPGSCHVLSVRNYGAVPVTPDL